MIAPATSLLSHLTEEISRNTSAIVEHLQAPNLPHPSFDADGPSHPIPEGDDKISAARHALIDATKALHALAVGPTETNRLFGFNEIYLVGAIRVLCHFNVPQHVPLQGTISTGELSAKSGLREALLSRFLRMAAANYYFTEPRPGFVAHTAWSRTLAADEKLRACVWFRYTEMMPSVAKLVEAVEKFPDSADPQEAAFSLAFGDTFFDYKEKHPAHMVNFGLFVDAFASGIEADTAESIARAYAWECLPAGSLIVDVGGGIGHISAAIAREHDQLTFHPEASSGAAVYFLRNIMHNWSDQYCRRILKPIVEAMGSHSRLLICDIVLPEPNTMLKTQESLVRALDLTMLSMFNARERSYDDWQNLFTSVDSRLRITAVVGRPKLGTDSVIEARLV